MSSLLPPLLHRGTGSGISGEEDAERVGPDGRRGSDCIILNLSRRGDRGRISNIIGWVE